MREGNLEAPTRHPIDWQSPEFHDEAGASTEMERIFDICHGCRRCVSLCQSFPTLFDLVDATADGEVDGVDKKDYWKVVDQCYLCDLCYMTKCPYVPPHPWNVDFPHLMLRAKAIKFKQGRGRRRREAARLDRRARPARRHPDRRAGGQRGEPDASRRARCSTSDARRPSRRVAARRSRRKRFRWRARRARRGDAGRRRRAHARQGRDLLDLLRQLQRARHRPRLVKRARAQRRSRTRSSRRRAAAACRSSSSAISKASRG